MEAIESTTANAEAGRLAGSKTRRRANAKPTEGGKRSLNLRIDEETYERLAIHALRRKATISELVMDFARTHLREFHITRTATRGESVDRAE